MSTIDSQVEQWLRRSFSRKTFIQTAGRGLAAGALGSVVGACSAGQQALRGAGAVPNLPPESPPAQIPPQVDEPIRLETWKSDADRQSPPTPSPLPPDQRVGYALVGLGHLTLEELLPAFGECARSKPVALVSGSPEKMQRVAQQYGIKPENCYNYETYDQLKDNPEVQAIYIVLPNGMHAEYTIRGAEAGKHILCEKPMANTPEECEAMIAACQRAQRLLMVAYRIQYEATNRLVRDLVRNQHYGKVKYIEAFNGQSSANPDHWRHKIALAGGGALPDIGLYCLNTIRFLLGEEPTEVFAYQYSTPGDPLFREVEEMVSWQMRFPSGLVTNSATHYQAHESRRYRVMAERGWMNMDAAFAYQGQQLAISYAEGQQERTEEVQLPVKNQFAAEIDHFSTCILEGKRPYTPGEEGLQDHRIMAAIYQSAREGRPVALPHIEGKDRFRGEDPKAL
ncbi:Predicted dehydrogenase [Catalinimonas alkaloidigena]|uniref:Predicted dehydrogenase n=1 Tax=Catalinimonas alkaloidigena TaxID=1075417 RepID=A0A1G9UDA0_9BACT|nr:Gfo/Idh/MocA family oxidoreductase [Catalinimonas alkaloidigena]SDM57899.1 Predicted dehydrogenase [Catalinimonas alkaloidigena]